MKCPNCGKEMINKSYSRLEPFYHWEDECTYYSKNHYEKFVCSDCKISIVNDEWNIPDNLQATEKQVKTCNFIYQMLNIESPPPAKRAMWQFIHDYIEEAIDISNKRKEWFYDYGDYDGLDNFAFPCEEDCF
jgi:hypothetical protein